MIRELVNRCTPGWSALLRRGWPAMAIAVAACTDVTLPVQPAPEGPQRMVVYCDDPTQLDCEQPPPEDPWVPGDTGAVPPQNACPDTTGIYVAPEVEQAYWSNQDTTLVNGDSLWAADGYLWESTENTDALMLLPWEAGSTAFSNEFGAMGPCEVLYARCQTYCRKIPAFFKRERRLCWAGCMAAYAACLAEEEIRKRGGSAFCFNSREVVYDPYDPYASTDCDGGYTGTGGGGGGGSTGMTCRSEYIIIEIDYGDGRGWQTFWEGYATVCE